MIETKYNAIDDELYHKYLKNLIGRFYKILPMKEEHSPTVHKYINSLQFELTGGRDVVTVLNNDGRFLSLINTLESLYDCDDIKLCKREIFKCIKTIEDLNGGDGCGC